MRIDLGRKIDDYCSPCPPPESAKSESRTVYPSLYLEGNEDLRDLPDEGTLTLRYKRVSKTDSERDGKREIRIELEAREILDATAKDDSSPKSRGQALDDLRNELDEDDED